MSKGNLNLLQGKEPSSVVVFSKIVKPHNAVRQLNRIPGYRVLAMICTASKEQPSFHGPARID